MGTPKGDSEDEIPHENVLQGDDPDAGGSNLGMMLGHIFLNRNRRRKGLQSDSTQQTTKADEKEGLAITAPEKVSSDTGQVNPTSGDLSSTSDHFKGPFSTNDEKGSGNLQGDFVHSRKEAETSKTPTSLQRKENLERGPNTVIGIHATGTDSKVDPSAKQAKEESDGLEKRLNHDARTLTRESCEGGGIVAVKFDSRADTSPQIQTPSSTSNMIVKFEAGSDGLPLIQTPNAVLPSSQTNQEKFGFSSEKSLDKLQPRRIPEPCIYSSSVTPEKPSEDGFNWRKYGQKLVKGNEFVRSYYRCTYHNCHAKRQVERSNAGHITDINYIGEHGHPRPQHIPQVGIAVVQPPPMRKPELYVVSSPEGITNVQPLEMRKPDLLIVSSPKAEKCAVSNNVVSQFVESEKASSPSTPAKGPLKGFTRDVVDNTSGPDLKKRKIDITSSNDSILIKHSSEPRQVVQTMSEVDLVNDGYRWRKYGQKLVKGNLNPRSYYRCSNAGCPAKKHVERASHDPKLVITTYEGQHCHEMPFTKSVTRNTSGEAVAAVIGESRSSETGEKTNGLEMAVHISAS
ncbi:hypothetical protein Leryth_021456 [Lithospermum erythrorhizon]|nr:hypothetical protein Leryth_021456 [Lithospermum erythrorhizon]